VADTGSVDSGHPGTDGGPGVDAGSYGTMVISGLTDVRSLVVVGSNLYWIAKGIGILTIPIAGGTLMPVFPVNMNIGNDLVSDGTSLYFSVVNPSMMFTGEVHSISLTGTGEKTIATDFFISQTEGTSSVEGSHLFVVNGNVYYQSLTGISSVPVAGGNATSLTSLMPGMGILELLWADTSGAYFTLSSSSFVIADVPLAGGAISTLATPQEQFAMVDNWAGNFIVAGGVAYYIDGGMISASTAALYKATPPSGPATLLKSYAGEHTSSIIADANGAYQFEGTPGVVYTVDLSTGAQSALFPQTLDSLVPLAHALDATNLYYVTQGSSAKCTIFAKSR
jgi:hypothetical protein